MCDDSEYFHVEHMVDEGAEEVIDGQGNEETSAGKNRLLHLVHEYVRLFNMHILFLGSGSFLPKRYMSSGARSWGWGGGGWVYMAQILHPLGQACYIISSLGNQKKANSTSQP